MGFKSKTPQERSERLEGEVGQRFGLRIVEVQKGDTKSIDRLYGLYKRLFPVADERQPKEKLLEYIAKNGTPEYGHGTYRIVLAMSGEKVAAFAIGCYCDSGSIAIPGYVGIAPEFRLGIRTGLAIFRGFMDVMRKDAERAGKTLNGSMIEVEKSDFDKGYMARKAALIYRAMLKKMGYREIDCRYIQPSLTSDQQPIELDLLFRPEGDYKLNRGDFLNAIATYIKLVSGHRDIKNLDEYKILEESVSDGVKFR